MTYWYGLTSLIGVIRLGRSIKIHSMDDAGKLKLVALIPLLPGGTLDDADKALEEEGYVIGRFDEDHGNTDVLTAIIHQECSHFVEPLPDDLSLDPPSHDPITESRIWPGDGEGGCGGYST